MIFSEPSLISNRLVMTKLVVLMSRGRRDTDSGSVAFINRSVMSEVIMVISSTVRFSLDWIDITESAYS